MPDNDEGNLPHNLSLPDTTAVNDAIQTTIHLHYLETRLVVDVDK